jgi:hypothetical protein
MITMNMGFLSRRSRLCDCEMELPYSDRQSLSYCEQTRIVSSMFHPVQYIYLLHIIIDVFSMQPIIFLLYYL